MLRLAMFIKIVTVFIVLISQIYGQYSDSIKLRSYKIYSIEDSRLCSPLVKRKIELSRANKSAVLIHQTRLNDHSIKWNKNLDCKFQIDVNHFDGLYAVIQSLEFRKNYTTQECIDYIRFKAKGMSYGPKICGKENIALVMPQERLSGWKDESRLSLVDPRGQIEVHLFVSAEPILPWQTMDVKIAFTAYKRCTFESPNSCSDVLSARCIGMEYFGDGIVNCPYPSCIDESDCLSVYHYILNNSPVRSSSADDTAEGQGPSTNTKVTAGAVATLLLSFVVFVVCVWVCRKYGRLCWAEDCVSSGGNAQNARTIEMQNRTDASVPSVSPSAPSSLDQNKDLPPSYDSLFPTR